MVNVLFENILEYNPITGLLFWKISPAKHIKIGYIAGRKETDGYIRIVYKGKNYQAHIIAWYLYHKRWPIDQIDHKNRIRHDNKLENLREATHVQNQNNRKDQSRYGPGIYRRKGKYYVKYKDIRAKGQYFTLEQANEARARHITVIDGQIK